MTGGFPIPGLSASPLRRIPDLSKRVIRVLALESSADDTCAAVVASDRTILGNVVKKQHHIHVKHGGIHPIKSQDAHTRYLPAAIEEALDSANMTVNEVDAIAYTRGPGMYGCLSVSAHAAFALAGALKKPLVGVHHMQAHALTPLMTEPEPPTFPFLTLLVSGGHTLLVHTTSQSSFRILAKSLDDSIGDAFDKTVKMLDIPWIPDRGPGPALENYARPDPESQHIYDKIKPLPRPTRTQMAFSFAGLKTATELTAKKLRHSTSPLVREPVKRAIARRFQEAAVDHVVEKVGLALDQLHIEGHAPCSSLVISGGVASNLYLRQRLEAFVKERSPGMRVLYPPIELCTDNAAMIGWAGILKLQQQDGLSDPFDLPIRAKWSIEDN